MNGICPLLRECAILDSAVRDAILLIVSVIESKIVLFFCAVCVSVMIQLLLVLLMMQSLLRIWSL